MSFFWTGTGARNQALAVCTQCSVDLPFLVELGAHEQEDVCDMEVDLAEVRRQESDAKVWNALAQELETVAECLPVEEEEDEYVNMRDDDRRDESDGEEQVPMEEGERRDGSMAHMEDGEQRDGSVPEREVHSKQDVERVKRALRKLHAILGHPRVKEMIRVLKRGRASELAIQEARRMLCDVCAENVQPKLPRPAAPRQVLDLSARIGLDILSLPHWGDATRSVKCLNIVCHGTLLQLIIPMWSETTALDMRRAYREGWQRWARDPRHYSSTPLGGKSARHLPRSVGVEL